MPHFTEGAVVAFSARVTELTAGGSACTVSGEAFKAVPRNNMNNP